VSTVEETAMGGEATLTALSGPLVTALERTWEDIRRHHHEVPHVVVTIGSGTLRERAGQVRLGHFAAGRWHAEGHELPELFVGGEGLERGSGTSCGTETTTSRPAEHGTGNYWLSSTNVHAGAHERWVRQRLPLRLGVHMTGNEVVTRAPTRKARATPPVEARAVDALP
jgi:hypothetical protein